MGACGSCARSPPSSSARSQVAERGDSRRRTRNMVPAGSSPSPVRPEPSGTTCDSPASRSTRGTAAKRLGSGARAGGAAAAAGATPAAGTSSSSSVSSLGNPSTAHPRKALDLDRATHTSTDGGGVNSVRRSSFQLHTLAYEGHSAAGDSAAGTPHRDSDLRHTPATAATAAASLASPPLPAMSLAQYTPTPPPSSAPRAPKQALLSYLEQYRTLQPHVRALYRHRRWRLVFSSDVHGTRMWERCQRVFTEEMQRWRHLHAMAAEAELRGPESPAAKEEVSVPVISLMETDLVVPAPSETTNAADPAAEPAVRIVDSHVCVGLYLHHVPDPGVIGVCDRTDVFLFVFEVPIQSPATSPAARNAIAGSTDTSASVSSPSAVAAATSGRDRHATATMTLVSRLQWSGPTTDAAYADLDEAAAHASPLRLPPEVAGRDGGIAASEHSGSTTPERCHVAATALPSPASPKTHTQRRGPGECAAEGGACAAGATSPPPPPLVSTTHAGFEQTSSVRPDRSPTLPPPSPGGSPLHDHHHRHDPPQPELDDATFSSRSARSTSTSGRGERRHASPVTHSTSAGYASQHYVVAAPPSSSAPLPGHGGGSSVPGAMPARVVAGQHLPRLAIAEEPNRPPLSPLSPLAAVGAAMQSPNTTTTPRSVSDVLTRSADAGATSAAAPVPLPHRRDGGRTAAAAAAADDASHALPSASGTHPSTFLVSAARTRVPGAAAAGAPHGRSARLSFDAADVVSATTTVVSATSVPGALWREEEDLTSYWPEAHGTATSTTAAGGGVSGGAHVWRRTLSGEEPAGAAAALMLHRSYISRVSSLIGDETADCYTPRQPRDRGVVHVDPTSVTGAVEVGGREAVDAARYTPPLPGLHPPPYARGDSGCTGCLPPAAVNRDGADGTGGGGLSTPTTAALASSSVRPVSTRVEVLSLLRLDATSTPPSAPAAAAAAAMAPTPSLGSSTPSSRGHLATKELGSDDAHDGEPQSLSGGGPSRTTSELHGDDSGAGGSLPVEAEGPLHVLCTTDGDLYVWDPRDLQLPPKCAAAANAADADDVVASRTVAAAVRAQADRCIVRCDGQRLQLNLRHLRCADAPDGGDEASAAAVGAESVLFDFVRAHSTSDTGAGGDVLRASLVKVQVCAVSSRPMPSALQRTEVAADA